MQHALIKLQVWTWENLTWGELVRLGDDSVEALEKSVGEVGGPHRRVRKRAQLGARGGGRHQGVV
jgi:hypothetical protein